MGWRGADWEFSSPAQTLAYDPWGGEEPLSFTTQGVERCSGEAVNAPNFPLQLAYFDILPSAFSFENSSSGHTGKNRILVPAHTAMSAPSAVSRVVDSGSLDDGPKRMSDVDSSDGVLENSEGVTHHDLSTLRHVRDKIPWQALTVAVVEFAECWTYNGTTVKMFRSRSQIHLVNSFFRLVESVQQLHPLPPGSVDGSIARADRAIGVAGALGMGQEKSFAIRTFNTFFVYVTPFLGAIIADTKWGRYKTIVVFTVVIFLGHIILVASATPASLQHPETSLGPLVLAIFVMAVGASSIKANVAPLIADQYMGKCVNTLKPLNSGVKNRKIFALKPPNFGVALSSLNYRPALKPLPVSLPSPVFSGSAYIYVNTGLSDNPMQSEICSHIGGKGNCFCRKCKVGGTQKDKAANNGYHALFEESYKAGVPRSKAQILEELQKQVKLACTGVSKPVKASQTDTGVKDTYTQFWIDGLITRFQQMKKDKPDRSIEEIQEELIQWTVDNRDKLYSPFLTMKGFDPAVDTPIEILHTILLGIIKYIWHITHSLWSTEAKQTYATRLQSTNTDGLSIHAIRSTYIMQYTGSLIGRQFKTIAQTNIFHLRGLEDLKVAVANVLDVFATIGPSKIITKIKYHLLVHADADVVQFGPLIGLATEGFESYNGVFQFCSILSNHLAPSRDIAIQLADQEGLKHRLTGGFWPLGADQKWTRAGSGKLVGWTEKKSVNHGDIKLVSLERGQKDRVSHSLESTNAAHVVNYGLYPPSESLDECFIDSWVFSKSPMAEFIKDLTIPGRISDILVDGAGVVLVVLEPFQVLASRDEMYGMPILNIKFKFNIQHDCHSADCEASGVRLCMQEHVESDQIEKYIIHEPLDRFIINTHTFHNAHLLRATLPQHLVAPVPLFADRESKHHQLVEELRDTQTKRKAAAAAKKRARADDDANAEEEEIQPRKKQKGVAKGKRSGPRAAPAASMVANRSRQQVKPTAKVKAAATVESDKEEEIMFADSEDNSEEDSMYGPDSDDCSN
ncbi:hypothetical protein DFH08DRAFT_806147 [Mycena albidolilacea]|uniref:Uncharacterized protein n=1 Tax=Mycena albidolilacea TaxID=1033008 RepID=A0AAD7EU91_9AGAR|nr:hypothetical protein DFH08DRAFT_806147 [Mycena albidolilacea]